MWPFDALRRRRSERDEAPIPLVLYTRADCPLCDAMKADVARAGVPVTLREVDVDADPELARRYGSSVPVLEIAGQVAFEGRLTVAALRARLARHAARTGAVG